MRTIWKFPLPVETVVRISMPAGASVLSVHERNGDLCLWALIDPDATREMREFRVHGTGHPVPEDRPLRFIGTAHLMGGALVFHVFEPGRGA
jgi:hypothetical protein